MPAGKTSLPECPARRVSFSELLGSLRRTFNELSDDSGDIVFVSGRGHLPDALNDPRVVIEMPASLCEMCAERSSIAVAPYLPSREAEDDLGGGPTGAGGFKLRD